MAVNNLIICTLNINGIANEHYNLQEFLKRENVDILLLQETRAPQWYRWRLPGYRTYYTPGPNPGQGGTAVAVRSSVTHSHVNLPPFLTLEATAITLLVNNCVTLVGTVYIPPQRQFDLQEFHTLTNLHQNFILGGDYNAKHVSWNSRLINARGRQLFRHAEDHDYSFIGPLSPTHFPPNPEHRPDVLDIYALRTPVGVTEISTKDELNSDHSPVLLTLATQALPHPLLNKPVRTVDWARFTATLSQITCPSTQFLNLPDLNQAITTYTNTIVAVYRTHSYVDRTPIAELIPDLQQLIQEKWTYRRRWQRLSNRADKHHLNFLQRRIHNIIRDFRIRRLEADIVAASRNNNIWPIVRRLRGPTGRANTPIHGTRGLVYDPLSKAEAIADTLETSFTPHPEDDAAVPWIRQVRRTVRQFPPVRDEVPIAPTGSREVYRLIKRSPRGTAPGLDKLTYEMLQHLPPKALRHLVILFNSALSLQVFPSVWKHAVIITLPKPGKNPIFPQNRRPISLLNVLGKLYERIISNRMLPVIRTH